MRRKGLSLAVWLGTATLTVVMVLLVAAIARTMRSVEPVRAKPIWMRVTLSLAATLMTVSFRTCCATIGSWLWLKMRRWRPPTSIPW